MGRPTVLVAAATTQEKSATKKSHAHGGRARHLLNLSPQPLRRAFMPNTPAPPSPFADRTPVAPAWHTALFVAFVVLLSVANVRQMRHLPANRNQLALYVSTIIFELAMVAYVWLLGLRPRGKRMRDLIGGRWARVSDVLKDIAVAILFWIVVGVVLGVLRVALGKNEAGVRAVKALLPHGITQMIVFVLLSIVAGFCEEFLFRGYLQRQFLAYSGNQVAAVTLQAVVFGFAHTYQGWRSAVSIAVYGAMFGILAIMRKSLRPGMIQHAMQDSFSGVVGSILARHGYF